MEQIDIAQEVQQHQELLAKIADMQKEAAAMQARIQTRAAIAVRTLMSQAGLKAHDLAEVKPKRKSPAVIYRNEAGKTWSGAGRRPNWLGDNPEQYRVQGQA